MFDESKKDACDLSKFINQLAFDVVFAPIEYQLKQVPLLKVSYSLNANVAFVNDLYVALIVCVYANLLCVS
jgi:hypothetical protein